MLGREIMGDAFGNGWVSAQTSGGAVALRLMADLLAQMPYYDRLKAKIIFDQMLEGLKAARRAMSFSCRASTTTQPART